MKMLPLKSLIFAMIGLILYPTLLLANASTVQTKIIQVYLNSLDNLIYVRTENQVDDNPPCGNSYHFVIHPTQNLAKELYAQALTAHTLQSPVVIGVSGCVGNYPKVYYIETH